ncbi:MAG TPA: hypothetical protein VE988_25250, partial [Gemmataceae bacterium]|nr:hypothetical protein [Gemmataceae bacterium]
MIRKLLLLGVAVFFGVTIGLLPSATAGPFRTVQQTKEPPLFGQPLPQPQPKYLPQQIPVPVVPAPTLPPTF